MHHASASGSTKCIDVLSAVHASMYVQNTKGAMPVHVAAYYARSDALDRLIHYRVSLNSRDSMGKTPLMLAAWRGRTHAVSVLLRNGAHVNVQDTHGWTALMYAAYTGRVAICRELIESLSDRAVVESRGKCAAELAIESGFYEVADMLQNKHKVVRTPSFPGDVQMHGLHVSRTPVPGALLDRQASAGPSPKAQSATPKAQSATPKAQSATPKSQNATSQLPVGLNIAMSKHAASPKAQAQSPSTPRTSLPPIPSHPTPSSNKNHISALQPLSTKPTQIVRGTKDSKPLQQKANRLARQHKAGKRLTTLHVPIEIEPDQNMAGKSSTLSDRIKDTMSRASLNYFDSHTRPAQDITRASTSRRKPNATHSLPELDSPFKRYHNSTWIRPYWHAFSLIVTLWMPNFVLSLLGKKTPGKRQAWREKIALCFIILLITAITAFVSFGLSLMLCHPVVPISRHVLAMHGVQAQQQLVAVRGRIYDVSDPRDSSVLELTDKELGGDASALFAPFPIDAQKCTLWPNRSARNCFGESGPRLRCIASTQAWTTLRRCQTTKWVVLQWKDVLRKANPEQLFVYNEFVYTLRPYMDSDNHYFGPMATMQLRKLVGTDATLAVSRSTMLQALVPCLNAQLRVGRIEGEPVGCVITSGVTVAVTVILNTMILVKLACAVLFDWAFSLQLRKITKHFTRGTSTRVPHVLVTVTCYNESEQALRNTLDSIALTNYARTRKLLLIVADGDVASNADARTTASILLGMVRPLDTSVPRAQPYMAIGEGPRAFNAATVTRGTYTSSNGISVACILVTKVGTSFERTSRQPKPGNRGKRDSQLIVMRWLRSMLMNDHLTPLEFELSRAATQLTCVHPDELEYVLMVDADTELDIESVPRLVAAMERDTRIMGLCGETRVANKRDSWVTRIQVYEYYISHHLSKAFESLWGGVTCLPGCCSMFRVYARKHGARVPLLVAPDVMRAYSTRETHTLHAKNLLELGEDRFLTTVLLRAFPTRKLIYVPRAVCRTTVPREFSELVAQRRRWINSTIHNLLELVLVRDLCGTFCCSMQFLVLMDLLGNAVLPASVAFCYYLVGAACMGQAVAVPLVLMALAFVLQGAMIVVTTQRIGYIYWMVIYILALPVWNFIMPVYAFWRFDDFSWGRSSTHADDNDTRAFITADERLALEPIPLKRWKDWMRDNKSK
ncbi:ATP-dependent RNA helicase [Coemansia sp. RSA 2440]|nr:ATP-dependent RNA helicase [Coemansia sp. RSA 2440]